MVDRRDDFPRTLFWRGKRGDRTWWAVRDGDSKYVRKTEGGQTDEWLFDLATDVGEEHGEVQAGLPQLEPTGVLVLLEAIAQAASERFDAHCTEFLSAVSLEGGDR